MSHQGAEELVAQWMRYLGEKDARVTRFTSDGGIDVQSERYVAQVKNSTGTVGVGEIREMAGVTVGDGRTPLFFTSGAYPDGAIEFANRVGMALFAYNAVEGSFAPVNPRAALHLRTGL